MKHLNQIVVNLDTVNVGSGAIWDDIIQDLDKKDLSVLVKQASNPFSVGGSIAMNCHGWDHKIIGTRNAIMNPPINALKEDGIHRMPQ